MTEERSIRFGGKVSYGTNCAKRECFELATCTPVLLVRPAGYEGPPARGQLQLPLCAAHAVKDPEAFLSDEGWAGICSSLVAAGFARPLRELTEVEFVPIHGLPAPERT